MVANTIPSVDSTPDSRSVSKKDELTYNSVLQNLAHQCLINKGTPDYGSHISALKSALYLRIPGLPFRARIDEKEKEMEQDVKDFIAERIAEYDDGIYYHPQVFEDLTHMHRALLKNELYHAKNDSWLEFLLQLLAEHNALMRSQEYTETGSDLTPEEIEFL